MKITRPSVALGVIATSALTTALSLTGTQEAVAQPNFQMPFTCDYTATTATYDDHDPQLSVDFQKSGITGDPVLASAPGMVSEVQNEGNDSYGKWIELDHGGGYTTRYAHLSVQQVTVGQKVSLGDQIGKAGATGGVSGPHLHYEQRHNETVQKAVLNGKAVPYYGHTPFTSKNSCGGGDSNPYTAKQVCGSGYSIVDSHALGKSGTVYLLYNSGNKKNCVTTLKKTSLGKKSPASAFLQVKGSKRVTDSGSFNYYAGPVSKAAAKTCVQWGGSVGSSKYTSPFEHCS